MHYIIFIVSISRQQTTRLFRNSRNAVSFLLSHGCVPRTYYLTFPVKNKFPYIFVYANSSNPFQSASFCVIILKLLLFFLNSKLPALQIIFYNLMKNSFLVRANLIKYKCKEIISTTFLF